MVKESKAKPTGYTKQQFLAAGSYTPQQKDILSAVLEEGKSYTREEAAREIEEFMKRTVK